jgi:hypothetical protein
MTCRSDPPNSRMPKQDLKQKESKDAAAFICFTVTEKQLDDMQQTWFAI